jgi:hypothetical protein
MGRRRIRAQGPLRTPSCCGTMRTGPELADQQRVVLRKLVPVDLEHVHAAEQEAGIEGIVRRLGRLAPRRRLGCRVRIAGRRHLPPGSCGTIPEPRSRRMGVVLGRALQASSFPEDLFCDRPARRALT